MGNALLLLYMAALAVASPTAAIMASSAANTTAAVDATAFYALVGTVTAALSPSAAPVLGNATEVVTIDVSSVVSAISSVVTVVATPTADAADGKKTTTTTTTTTSSKKTSTSSYGNCKTTTTVQTSTPATVATTTSSTSSLYVSVPSTCTPVSWTNTNSYTSTTACPTAIEVGTYCGFINPLDPCAPQLAGSAPSPTADTVSAFLADASYASLAAHAATPSGYIPTFTGLDAAVSANTYLGYETLAGYDTAACAALCDATALCTGFNVYIERDPGWNPDQCSCADPASTYNFKCSIFAGGVYALAATNDGQYRDEYEVVITASNGYMVANTTYAAGTTTTSDDSSDDDDAGTVTARSMATRGSSSGSGSGSDDGTQPCLPDGASQPQSCWGKTHSHPDTLLTQAFFPGPFSIDVCIWLATSQSELNLAAAVNVTAAFVNAALVVRDGVAWGTFCGVFTQPYGGGDCNWAPGSSWGHDWSIQDSWGVEVDVEVLLSD